MKRNAISTEWIIKWHANHLEEMDKKYGVRETRAITSAFAWMTEDWIRFVEEDRYELIGGILAPVREAIGEADLYDDERERIFDAFDKMTESLVQILGE